MPLENYSALMGEQFDPVGSFARGQQAGLLEQQIAAAQQQMAQQQAAQQQMQRDIAAALENPSAAAFSDLITRYPDHGKEFQEAWNIRDEGARNTDLQALGGIIAAIDNDRTDLALRTVEERKAANDAAGVPQEAVDVLRDALAAGDTKRARGIAAYLVALAAGPEKLNEFVNPKEPDNKVIGNALVTNDGRVVYQGPEPTKVYKVNDADGNEQLVELGGAGGTPAAGGATGGFDAFYSGFLAPTEGGFAARDGKSGAPVNFGVNQAANPDIDVAKLTQPQAAAILRERYWVPSGADEIADPALQAVHADTAVNMGVGTAKQMLQASGGDVNRYLGLREARYRKLGGPDLPSWLNRNERLRSFVGGGAAKDGARVVYSPGTPSGGPSQEVLEKRFGKPGTGYRLRPDGTAELIPGVPKPGAAGGKTLPAPVIDKLSEESNIVSQITGLIGGFDDNYSGPGRTVANFFGRYGVGTDNSTRAADWWQQLDAFDNVVRNKLFGASLTDGERAAWEKTTVSPGMDPARIKANLKARDDILRDALKRKIAAFGAAGYDAGSLGDVLLTAGGAPDAPAGAGARGPKIDMNKADPAKAAAIRAKLGLN